MVVCGHYLRIFSSAKTLLLPSPNSRSHESHSLIGAQFDVIAKGDARSLPLRSG